MKKIWIYHGMNGLLFLFLFLTVLLVSGNILVSLGDLVIVLPYIAFALLIITLMTFINSELRDEIQTKMTFWERLFHHQMIVIIILLFHLGVVVAHWRSIQLITTSYVPEFLFGINIIVFLISIMRERRIVPIANNRIWSIGWNLISFLLFAVSMYFVIMPF